jgi:GNAT superfamily N-acetyltransferase
VTTTLRPTGPEQFDVEGVRSRCYDICVNSRPVGSLKLSTDPQKGPTTGRVVGLAVDDAERRRGRGAVAALSAEEVLRRWGCNRVETSIPADAHAALGLAGSLGYQERGRSMLKELGDRPRLPPGSEDRAMTQAEFPAWRERGQPLQQRLLAERGVPPHEVVRRAADAFDGLLPLGADTPTAALRVLVHDGEEVGVVWVELERSPRRDAGAYVYEVEVDEAYRGRGHGRSLMLVAEREALDSGAGILGLHVYAYNTPALNLYSSLGYRPVELHFFKPLL